MNFDELTEIHENTYDSPLANLLKGKIESLNRGPNEVVISINNKIAIPIVEISPVFDDSYDIEIFDEAEQFYGIICFMRNKKEFIINELTEWQLAALLTGATSKQILGNSYHFSYDYLTIEAHKYAEYVEKYYSSAPLWGMFSHVNMLEKPYQKQKDRIIAIADLSLPTFYHIENCLRAMKVPYAFERFLKLYHLLELVFDYSLVQDIKSINDDLLGIAKILNDYNQKDIERLKTIIHAKCFDIQKIATLLNKLTDHMDKAKLLFFDFGKESNTFKAFNELEGVLKAPLGFCDNANIKTQRNIKETDCDRFILNTAVYFVYRIRCSIVHNKIGEYVMTNDDESFVAEFGEPLLTGILLQVFKENE